MKKAISVLLSVLLLVAVVPTFTASAKTSEETAMAKRMVQLVNNLRAENGVAPLDATNPILEKCADIRAKELVTNFSHTRPDGSSCFSVMEEYDLTNSYAVVGENIAYAYGYPDITGTIFESWANSPGHRGNMLDPDFEQIAIGLYKYNNIWYWVQLFYAGPVTGHEPFEGTPFMDISMHWGRDAIRWVYEAGLFSGVTASTFGPDKPMDRAMLAEVLYRMAGRPGSSTVSQFPDVPDNAYYKEALNWAVENGIVMGIGGLYKPSQKITREQLAVMLYRYATMYGPVQSTGNLNAFQDGYTVSSYAKQAMAWAVGEGIITGKGNGKLDPKGSATRAEVATMLQRYAG